MKEYRRLELFFSRLVAKGARMLHLTAPTIATYEVAINETTQFKSKSNSWVRNMLNMMAFQGIVAMGCPGTFYEDGSLRVRAYDSTNMYQLTRLSTGGSYGYGFTSGARSVGVGGAEGIALGTSDVAETFDDFKLGERVLHGSGSGQLVFQAQTVNQCVWDSVSRKWVCTIQRAFINNSGGTIVMKELGIIERMYGGNSAIQALILRDVLPTPVTILDGQTATVTYTFEYYF